MSCSAPWYYSNNVLAGPGPDIGSNAMRVPKGKHEGSPVTERVKAFIPFLWMNRNNENWTSAQS